MSTAALFERLAPRYDELWTDTAIGRAQRNAVWRVVDGLFRAGDRVLDIGCGTGEDATHLAARGVCVRAVDASPAMVARAAARGVEALVMRAEDLGKLVAGETVCPTNAAEDSRQEWRAEARPTTAIGASWWGGLEPASRVSNSWSHEEADLVGSSACQGERSSPAGGVAAPEDSVAQTLVSAAPRLVSALLAGEDSAPMSRGAAGTYFDGAISNFGALNCVADLAPVARALGALVRPGGHLAICTIGRFCAWEMLYYKKAFRRLSGRSGDVYYPTVRQLSATFAPDFELLHWTGIGMLVPPSYVRLPARIVNFLARLDRLPFLRACADHRLLVFKRK